MQHNLYERMHQLQKKIIHEYLKRTNWVLLWNLGITLTTDYIYIFHQMFFEFLNSENWSEKQNIGYD